MEFIPYFLCTYFVSCSSLICPQTSSASISWNATSFSLPTTAPGEIRDALFVFENHFPSPISIHEATSDCGCINVRRPYGAILPNATGAISARIRASRVEGPYKERIYISFDNGHISELLITGKTHSLFKAEPQSIKVHDAVLNASRTVSFDITIDEGVEAEILDARLENSDIELMHFATAAISNGVRCCLTLVPRVPKRRIISTLILQTSHKRQPIFRVALIVYSALPIDIRPPVAFFGVVKPNTKASKKFSLKSKDSSAIRIKSIKDGKRQAKFTTEKANGSLTLKVELLCADRPGFATGELLIELEDPSAPKVSIPYSYMLRE